MITQFWCLCYELLGSLLSIIFFMILSEEIFEHLDYFRTLSGACKFEHGI